jgi:hypothetical protein
LIRCLVTVCMNWRKGNLQKKHFFLFGVSDSDAYT